MSYFDDRQSSVTNGLQLPRLDNRHSLVEQLPFPESTPFPGRTTHQLEYEFCLISIQVRYLFHQQGVQLQRYVNP